jgi:mRNA capping enzyme, catalytic domain
MTLLDGEMVVDEDSKTGTCRRRYLAYDMMVLNQKVLADRPFRVCAGPHRMLCFVFVSGLVHRSSLWVLQS